MVLLDLSDPAHPRYAEHNPDVAQNPGSVGKLMVALAWFQALADRYPEDLEARRRLLRETQVVADAFIQSDHHTVPFWKPGDARVVQRRIAQGDRANLWTYLDWMASSSSNAAAAMAQKHLLLQRGLGARYPVSEAEATAYLPRRRRPSSASSSRTRSSRRSRALGSTSSACARGASSAMSASSGCRAPRAPPRRASCFATS